MQNITEFVNRAYHAYFKVKLGDQDKSWAPHKVCKSCVELLRSWSKGKEKHLPFGIPMIWRESKSHFDDWYFCMVNVMGCKKSDRHLLNYPNLESAIRPVPHCSDLPVPIFTEFLGLMMMKMVPILQKSMIMTVNMMLIFEVLPRSLLSLTKRN
ncbi:hypothetical protein LOD99_6754 [Oopsacas minuta]|uniref:Uncharacterized protein n=1 Tax=Oopsacas minuta TaxID=111878 RepID=A0AAV7JKV1_9METZ|nr:hypothetical protein LOD99_6739 [Oopsacas minuta]KAI6649588.1 hypothetical protein LOD99_6754 [Oopsacas minuta]